MTHAIRFHRHGCPEVLQWEEITVPDPGPGEVKLRHTAIGLNYIDIYFRDGLYKPPSLPTIPGQEGAGIVLAVGPGVTEFKPGDRVAYPTSALGAYAEERLIRADRLVKLPPSISDQQAAAMMLQGMTAHYLIRRTHRVQPGETILVHAAAGGVGLILCQWAHHLGATVIGTVGNADKAALAQANGCTHPILYTQEDFAAVTRRLTGDAGVPVVYDSVGRDTFMKSLDCLQPLGLMISFGQSSGAVDPIPPGVLAAKGSLFLTRPTLATYIAKREDLLAAAQELFEVVASGAVKVGPHRTYPLKDAAQAHRDLASRKTVGSSVLIP